MTRPMKGIQPIEPLNPADLTQVVHFGHNVPELSPPTPGAVVPDVVFVREVFNDELRMPDRDVPYWAFKDPEDDKPFPSTVIRLRQGQVAHTVLETSKNVHTIHHHGLEPSTFNDGVGHTSFHVKSRYAYQWRPSHAGTYVYHCHRNTPVHFQMGMWGALIVDPPSGPGRLFEQGPAYDAEAVLAAFDIDSTWHEVQHHHGEARPPDEVPLNRFTPDYFTVNGVPPEFAEDDLRTVVRAQVGDLVLLRHLNCAYSPLRTTFGGLPALVVGSDGRPVPAPYPTDELFSTVAERYDVLLRPDRPGTYPITFRFSHWLRGHVIGSAVAYLVVA